MASTCGSFLFLLPAEKSAFRRPKPYSFLLRRLHHQAEGDGGGVGGGGEGGGGEDKNLGEKSRQFSLKVER